MAEAGAAWLNANFYLQIINNFCFTKLFPFRSLREAVFLAGAVSRGRVSQSRNPDLPKWGAPHHW